MNCFAAKITSIVVAVRSARWAASIEAKVPTQESEAKVPTQESDAALHTAKFGGAAALQVRSGSDAARTGVVLPVIRWGGRRLAKYLKSVDFPRTRRAGRLKTVGADADA